METSRDTHTLLSLELCIYVHVYKMGSILVKAFLTAAAASFLHKIRARNPYVMSAGNGFCEH